MSPLSAEVRMLNGRPTIFVNGQARVPLIYALSDIPASKTNTAQAQRNIAHFAAQGIDLLQIDTALAIGWRKTGQLELDFLFSEIEYALDANPNAEIIIRLHNNAPYWWMRDNPDELTIYGSGGAPYVDTGEYERLITGDNDNRMRVSFASEKWLAEAGAKLAELCQRLAEAPQGQRVIGIQIAGGMFGEWHQWGMGCDPDYGSCMQHRFRRFLREKYGSDEALRQAWQDPTAALDTAELAPPATRYAGGDGMFRVTGRERAAMDALKCLQLSVPTAISHFCRIVKANWNRPLLTGSFYGYFFGTGNGARTTIGGHLEVEELCRTGSVDFLSGPFPYYAATRSITGVSVSRGLHESSRLNRILWLTEMDQHPAGTEQFIGGDPAHRCETIAMLRRNVLESITHGQGCWYYDHRIIPSNFYRKNGWWDHPDLLREVRLLREVSARYTQEPYRPTADVALIFDTEAYYCMPRNGMASKEVEERLLNVLGHTGVAYDCIYLHDIGRVDWSAYRCVVFVNTVLLDQAGRRYIRETIARDGRHLVWFHAAGYFDEQGSDTANITSLTGVAVRRAATGQTFRTLGPVLPSKTVQVEFQFDPQFVPADAEAETIGFFTVAADAAGNVPAAARKRLADSTAWLFSLPPLDVTLLREIFRAAGAHVYSEGGESLLAGSGLIVVTAVEAETLRLALRSGRTVTVGLPPMSTTVFDAATGEIVLG